MRRLTYIIVLIFATFVSGNFESTSSLCPVGCQCSPDYKHAKCNTQTDLLRFNRTSTFESLDLSGIGLRKITSHLDKFTNLEKIDLSGNRLSEVNKLPKGIKDLNLSNNRITSAKLSKIPKSVVNLNLSDNHITYVPHSIMTLKYLRHLELSGNPINCTCDTLAVRNWLNQQHVWSDRHITCMAPLKFKGRPWLQMKQAEVCEVTVATKKTNKFLSKYNWDEIEKNDNNELMQRDQEGSGDDDGETLVDDEKIESSYDNDEEDDDYEYDTGDKEEVKKVDPVEEEVKEEHLIPVEQPSTTTSTTTPLPVSEDDEDYATEGSGAKEGSGSSEKVPIVPLIVSTEPTPTTESLPISSSVSDDDEYDDDEGSGSDEPLIVPSSVAPVFLDVSSSTTESDITFEPESSPSSVEPSTVLPETLPELNIFDESLASSSTTEEPASDVVVPRAGSDNEETESISPLDDEEKGKENVMQAKTDDNQNTFILLGVLGVLLIGLIIYVAVKDKSKKRNRRSKQDVEIGPAKELKEMNKDLLGKEKGNGHHGNGNHAPEKSPLINHNNEKPKNGHSYPAISPNKIGTDDLDTPYNTSPMSTFKPIKEHPQETHAAANDDDDAPKTEPNNNSLPTQSQMNGDLPEVHETKPASPKRYSPVYTPRTPKLGNNNLHLSDPKYSPVYSPETGRVKVKATEMPRPKTPVLVTRTKSSAGDYQITASEEVH